MLNQFFSERVVNVWNVLPVDRAGFGPVAKFKRSLAI